MRIKAAVLRVVNARAQVGEEHLGHALEVLGDGIVWVCHSGRVLRGCGPENVGALQRVSGRLTQKALDDIAAGCPTVHLGEGLQSELPRLLILEVWKETIGLEVPY